MKLYFNPASPFVRKVLVVAKECGAADQLEIEEIALTPVNPHIPLNSHNPLGKIPALVLDDNQNLYDSRVICEYLDSTYGSKLFPAGSERWTVLRQQAIADGLCDASVLVRYESFVRPKEKQWSEYVEAQLNKCHRAIALLDQECAEFGERVDIATLSTAIALEYFEFRNPDEVWQQRAPTLAKWLSDFSQRQSLLDTRPA